MGNIDRYYKNDVYDLDHEDIYGFYEMLKEVLIVLANYASTFESEN